MVIETCWMTTSLRGARRLCDVLHDSNEARPGPANGPGRLRVEEWRTARRSSGNPLMQIVQSIHATGRYERSDRAGAAACRRARLSSSILATSAVQPVW
jgi:hypothetical protein